MFVECDFARILANPQSLRLLFVMVCRGLFEKDKLLYSATQLAILTGFGCLAQWFPRSWPKTFLDTLIHFTSQFSSDPRLGYFLGLLYPFCGPSGPLVLSRLCQGDVDAEVPRDGERTEAQWGHGAPHGLAWTCQGGEARWFRTQDVPRRAKMCQDMPCVRECWQLSSHWFGGLLQVAFKLASICIYRL